jgi:hypothetical protein
VLNSLFSPRPDQITSLKTRCDELIKRGDSAFTAANASRVVTQAAHWVLEHPLTMRVALCIDPPVDGAKPTRDFLRAFASGNPNYNAGWPMWFDSRAFHDAKSRPLVKDSAWQALILDLESMFPHSDFMLLDPRGDFFLRRLVQDDLRPSMTEPGKLLDVALMLYRVTEVLAVGLAVAKSCGWAAGGTAGFELRWSGLEGRSLGSWANPISWEPTGSGKAHDAEAKSLFDVPLDTSPSALAPYVSRAVSPLFSAFDGYVPAQQLVEDCVRRVIERKIG